MLRECWNLHCAAYFAWHGPVACPDERHCPYCGAPARAHVPEVHPAQRIIAFTGLAGVAMAVGQHAAGYEGGMVGLAVGAVVGLWMALRLPF